ncbi:hypothetical protein P3T37_000778 [Kitasatospora sp. MAA4]|uniref:acyl carrier protein n=1 Tax=Kitasatospora sp. MAA4 TaxID=3035093 RepID=UPI002474401B|nr:acyl carrier protein [Kitasatospora sp. MAA4]MDH6131409.1 hypothetical protein [Kitasatospora sp. MAA4]
MSATTPLGRDEVLAMLAAFGDREPHQVDEALGSLELTWLITEVEQRYTVSLDLSDGDLDRMVTVTGATEVLCAALAGGAGHA